MRTYPLRNLDAGLANKTRLLENLLFEFRAEAYSVTNTPWFKNRNGGATDVSRSEFAWYSLSAPAARSVTLIGKLIW